MQPTCELLPLNAPAPYNERPCEAVVYESLMDSIATTILTATSVTVAAGVVTAVAASLGPGP